MRNVVTRFEKILQRINLIYGLLIPAAIGVIMGRLVSIVNPQFFQDTPQSQIVYYTLWVIGVAVILIQIFARKHNSNIRYAFFYTFYNIAIGLFVLFVDPYPTPFAFQFIAL